MAMMIYMRIKAQRQGEIEGDCAQPDREKTIMCYSMDHHLELAGGAVGQPVHSPFKVSTHMGKHTHKIIQACRDREPLDVEIDVYRVSPNGLEEQYFRIKLNKAIVERTRQWFPTMLIEDNKPYKHMQDITFTYESVSWVYVPEEAEVKDAWRSPPPAAPES